MLSGEMKVHEQPKSYTTSGYQHSHYIFDDDYHDMSSGSYLSTRYAELTAATKEATEKGFVPGAKIRRKGVSGICSVGTVVGHATTVSEGFDNQNRCQPIGVMWGLSNSPIYYPIHQLEIIKPQETPNDC